MKSLIIFTLLFIASTVYGLDKTITGEIANQSDMAAVRIEIYDINTGDETIWARLYDRDDKLVTNKRVYSYVGDHMPVILLDSEIELIDGKEPAEWWDLKTMKLYMESKQGRDEDGNVLQDDPFIVKSGASTAEILEQLEAMKTE